MFFGGKTGGVVRKNTVNGLSRDQIVCFEQIFRFMDEQNGEKRDGYDRHRGGHARIGCIAGEILHLQAISPIITPSSLSD